MVGERISRSGLMREAPRLNFKYRRPLLTGSELRLRAGPDVPGDLRPSTPTAMRGVLRQESPAAWRLTIGPGASAARAGSRGGADARRVCAEVGPPGDARGRGGRGRGRPGLPSRGARPPGARRGSRRSRVPGRLAGGCGVPGGADPALPARDRAAGRLRAATVAAADGRGLAARAHRRARLAADPPPAHSPGIEGPAASARRPAGRSPIAARASHAPPSLRGRWRAKRRPGPRTAERTSGLEREHGLARGGHGAGRGAEDVGAVLCRIARAAYGAHAAGMGVDQPRARGRARREADRRARLDHLDAGAREAFLGRAARVGRAEAALVSTPLVRQVGPPAGHRAGRGARPPAARQVGRSRKAHAASKAFGPSSRSKRSFGGSISGEIAPPRTSGRGVRSRRSARPGPRRGGPSGRRRRAPGARMGPRAGMRRPRPARRASGSRRRPGRDAVGIDPGSLHGGLNGSADRRPDPGARPLDDRAGRRVMSVSAEAGIRPPASEHARARAVGAHVDAADGPPGAGRGFGGPSARHPANRLRGPRSRAG